MSRRRARATDPTYVNSSPEVQYIDAAPKELAVEVRLNHALPAAPVFRGKRTDVLGMPPMANSEILVRPDVAKTY